jgi:L-alanine-DL-glutamate epimerase-like enolase superfamily enzyme
MAPEDTGKEAEVGAKLGFTSHKLKARPFDIVQQVELITKAAGPNFSILVDPNFKFNSLPATIKLARQLEPYNILCFEDPFPWLNNIAQYRLFRQRTDIPIAPHCSRLNRAADVLNVLKQDAADMFNVGGNVAAIQQQSALADAAGLPVWQQAYGLSLGIGAAFAVHLAASVRNATIPSDILHFLREHDLLVDDPIRPVDGHIAVPEGPGLGVELDEKALAKYRVG